MAVFYKGHFFKVFAVLLIVTVISSEKSFGAAKTRDFENARKLYSTGQYSECIKSAKKAIVNGANEPQWQILLVESLLEVGRYEQAARETETALQYHPLSIRLLKLGYKANLHNGRHQLANEKLSYILRVANKLALEYWDGPDVVALGEVLLILGAEPKIVMDQFYNRVLKSTPDCREAYLAAGELALDKQDFELAAEQYRKGLEYFGDDPDMHWGLAKSFYHSDRTEMAKSIDAALFINPNHTRSLLLMAEHQIDCEDYAGAGKSLDKVTSVNPSNPHAWAYRCVLAHMANDPDAVKKTRAAALRHWSTNPKVDYLIGFKLSQKYRFAESEKYQRQALSLKPDYLPAKIQLAQDLLRLGHEAEGWKLADQVYNKDAYNVQAYNLVNLRDHMAKFAKLQAGHLTVRMAKDEAAVYGREVLELLTQAELELCEKYGIKLDGPVILELFPDQQDFAVRTFGIPGGDGFLGVCFGNVITANSPKAQRPYNWKATLWHEFCHVVTLNMTRNKMPRWLSEGISVYEELQKNPTWGQRMNPQYREMILDGQLTPISELSAAFLSPETPMHLQFAYYQSCLAVEFLVDNYGYESLKAILADLAEGKDINSVISEHAEPLEIIEKKFEAFAIKRAEDLAPDADWEQPEQGQLFTTDAETLAEQLKEHPNNIWTLTLYAGSLMADGKWEQAKEPLNKLIKLYPQNIGTDNPYQLLAEAHRKLGETEQEQEVLEKLAANSSNAINAYERLMQIAEENENWRQVATNGERYLAVYPMPTKLHWQLGNTYEKLGRSEKAIGAYRRLLSLDYADPAELNYRLGRLLEQKDPAAAKRHVLLALAEAPRFRAAHKLLLKIIEGNSSKQREPVSNEQIESTTTQEQL